MYLKVTKVKKKDTRVTTDIIFCVNTDGNGRERDKIFSQFNFVEELVWNNFSGALTIGYGLQNSRSKKVPRERLVPK